MESPGLGPQALAGASLDELRCLGLVGVRWHTERVRQEQEHPGAFDLVRELVLAELFRRLEGAEA